MEIKQRSAPQRQLWAQFDALQMGSGWDEEDIQKPQILLEDVFGDSHPGSTHLGGIMEQAKYGVFEKGGYPAQYHTTDICDGCAQGHDGMNYILASREAICDMIEVHGSVYPWDGVILSASCDKSIVEISQLLEQAGQERGLSIRIQREDIFNAMHRI